MWVWLSLAGTPAGAAAPSASFLLPGVGPEDINLEVGRWCRYVVIDEAEGVVDSSSFYIAVLGCETVAGDESYWVEVETGPLGAPPADREVTKALVSGGIRGHARGDSLYRYVHQLYIRKGNEPVEAADPVDLKRITLTNPTSESDWIRQPSTTVSTPMGSITSDRKELTVEDTREIPTGRVKLVRRNVDRFTVWSSHDVPIFSLVKCVIERSREARTVPAVPGIPNEGAKESSTTVLVLGYGSNARPILAVP